MNITITEAKMTYKKDTGYVGQVIFGFPEHKTLYEITLYSSNKKQWDYSLNFARESGREEDILLVEELLEENDEVFDQLVDAAQSTLE